MSVHRHSIRLSVIALKRGLDNGAKRFEIVGNTQCSDVSSASKEKRDHRRGVKLDPKMAEGVVRDVISDPAIAPAGSDVVVVMFAWTFPMKRVMEHMMNE